VLRIRGSGSCFSFYVDTDPTFHFDADQDRDSSFHCTVTRIWIRQIHVDWDSDPTFQFDADPDPQHCLALKYTLTQLNGPYPHDLFF
jgi:hypothetical protein